MNKRINEETRYKLLNLLHENPDISQRQLANEMDVSLGKANYCIKALLEVGLVKLNNFKCSKNKLGYVYVLTRKGVKEKAQVTLQFLEIKQEQYNQIKNEISDLKREVSLSKNGTNS